MVLKNGLECSPNNYKRVKTDYKYIVVHYTANKNDTAANNCKYFHNNKVGASAHIFVDEKEALISVPLGYEAWHCGARKYNHKYCRNNNSIGVEMCTSWNDEKLYIKNAVVENTINVIKYLQQCYNIPDENVIRHFDVTGKNCPAPYVDESNWVYFKNKLKKVETKNYIAIKHKNKIKECETINKDGFNFVKVRDLVEVLEMNVEFNKNVIEVK